MVWVLSARIQQLPDLENAVRTMPFPSDETYTEMFPCPVLTPAWKVRLGSAVASVAGVTGAVPPMYDWLFCWN